MWKASLLIAVGAVGCAFGVDISNKPCPCAAGFVCDTARDVCVRGAPSDAGGLDSSMPPTDGGPDVDSSAIDSGPARDGGATGWVAYDDLAWTTGQLDTRITTITSSVGTHGSLASSGLLVDHATGAPTAVTLAVTGGSLDWTTDVPAIGCDSVNDTNCRTASMAPASDAAAVFGGIVDTWGTMSYGDGATTVLTLSGMSAARRYEVVFYGHRGTYAWDRTTTVSLGGASSFQNRSSTGMDTGGNPLFTSATDPVTRLPADNAMGWVARFDAIDPGADGAITLTLTTVDASDRGKYANAIRVSELR